MQHGEKLNTITHLGGAVLAFGASIPLLARAFNANGDLGLVSTAVYAISLVLMYACSTAYHGASGSLKQLLQRLDHLSIYLKPPTRPARPPLLPQPVPWSRPAPARPASGRCR
jgi:hemolysin III